ncbi:MAG: PIN domain-containing protein [Campylobacterales bacterium]|nr:PIN domain-containing protein [Campylobacterales bacterium]
MNIFEILEDMGVEVLDFDGKSAMNLFSLPYHHRDPFDRMIICQSLSHGFKIISDDSKFSHYDCELLK